jgi:hypothetical protein
MLMNCDDCPIAADCTEIQHCARAPSYFADYPDPTPVTGKPIIRKDLLEAIVTVVNANVDALNPRAAVSMTVMRDILVEDGYTTRSECNICAVIGGKERCISCGDNGERAKIDASGRCLYCVRHNH